MSRLKRPVFFGFAASAEFRVGAVHRHQVLARAAARGLRSGRSGDRCAAVPSVHWHPSVAPVTFNCRPRAQIVVHIVGRVKLRLSVATERAW